MSNYSSDFTLEFDKDFKKTKSDFALQKRLTNKIEEILENPFHYKPLRNILKNRRRTQIGSYVLIFEIREREKTVVFHSFKYHDEAYK
jgi:mRNA-degrading endonuclease RelE of RelBE toxin-antitoxin system